MAKQKKKSHKAVSKRIKRTKKGKGKLKTRKSGQGHFNARANAKKKHQRRQDNGVSKGEAKNIDRLA